MTLRENEASEALLQSFLDEVTFERGQAGERLS